MFTIHKVQNDPTKVLVEADVALLMVFMAAFGAGSTASITNMMYNWGIDSQDARDCYNLVFDNEYSEVKAKVREIFNEMLIKNPDALKQDSP